MSVAVTGKEELLTAKTLASFLTPLGPTPHLLHQQALFSLPSTDTQNTATSHHLHCSQAKVTIISLVLTVFILLPFLS